MSCLTTPLSIPLVPTVCGWAYINVSPSRLGQLKLISLMGVGKRRKNNSHKKKRKSLKNKIDVRAIEREAIEKVSVEREAKESVARERAITKKAAAKKAAREKAAAEKAVREKAAAEKLAAGREVAEKLAAVRAAIDKAAAERTYRSNLKLYRVAHVSKRESWLDHIRSLNGRCDLKALLQRYQEHFFTWPLLPRSHPSHYEPNSDFLAVNCETVETEDFGNFPVRVAVVNYYGKRVLDVYINPNAYSRVVNWRTPISGVSPEVIEGAIESNKVVSLADAQVMIGEMFEKHDAVLVGHNVMGDLSALQMELPKKRYIDTQRLPRFISDCGGCGLRRVVGTYFNLQIQHRRGHDPVEDARAAMLVFRTFQREFQTVSGVPFYFSE